MIDSYSELVIYVGSFGSLVVNVMLVLNYPFEYRFRGYERSLKYDEVCLKSEIIGNHQIEPLSDN